MQEISEAEIYDFITKNGKDVDSIRKNTQLMRDRLEEEKERRIHSLSKFDPQNRDRHEREASRIFEGKSRKLDDALMQIAENSPAQLPLHREAMLGASKKLTGSRRSANYVRTFIVTYILGSIVTGGFYYAAIYVTPNAGTTSSDDNIKYLMLFILPLVGALTVTFLGKKQK